MAKLINESLGFLESWSLTNDKLGTPFPEGPIFRTKVKTRIMIGHGFQEFNGVSSLQETVFDGENMIPIGACQFVFEQLASYHPNANTSTMVPSQLKVPTLYELSPAGNKIGYPDRGFSEWENDNDPEASYKFTYPSFDDTSDVDGVAFHQLGEQLCLFGIGLTGDGTNTVTRPAVNYLESSIYESMANENGRALTGTMIPFRYTDSMLSDTDRWKYFGRTADPSTTDAKVGYYLKRFEQAPVIRHVWKADELDVEQNIDLVSQQSYYPRTETTKTGEIETYLEMKLKITSRDVKEWFSEVQHDIDATRINTIALFTGRYHPNLAAPGSGRPGDYENVKMFSKLTIPVENLSLSKDFDIIYRIYSA